MGISFNSSKSEAQIAAEQAVADANKAAEEHYQDAVSLVVREVAVQLSKDDSGLIKINDRFISYDPKVDDSNSGFFDTGRFSIYKDDIPSLQGNYASFSISCNSWDDYAEIVGEVTLPDNSSENFGVRTAKGHFLSSSGSYDAKTNPDLTVLMNYFCDDGDLTPILPTGGGI